jgi:hypothetical protein
MTFWVLMSLLMFLSAPALLAIAMLLSVPIAVVAALSAWNDYRQPVPPPDALYLSPLFWVTEVVGVVSLLFCVVVILDTMRR